jgi:LysR family transcriptional regulator, regulator for metE and metH
LFREVLIPARVVPARVTHIQLTEAIVELVKGGLGVSVLPRFSVVPQLERHELVARRLTREGKYRAWRAAWRASGAPDYLVEFVELLARHPLPHGVGRLSPAAARG